MIQQTVDYCHGKAQEKYKNIKVIYGDSVTKNTLITLELPEKTPCGNASIVVKTMEEVWELVEKKRQKVLDSFCPREIMNCVAPETDAHEKQSYFTFDLGFKVWSDSGFTPMKSIIRHLPRKQKMFRIKTKKGIVEVTADHSLLQRDPVTKEIKCVKPTALKVGDKLVHKKFE